MVYKLITVIFFSSFLVTEMHRNFFFERRAEVPRRCHDSKTWGFRKPSHIRVSGWNHKTGGNTSRASEEVKSFFRHTTSTGTAAMIGSTGAFPSVVKHILDEQDLVK